MSLPQLPQLPQLADALLVHEIYRSVQGETSFAGLPCTLVRLSACNLRCRWCDTPQAFTGGTRMPRAEVLARALRHGTQLVLVTGGEPLLQAGVLPLMTELCDAGRTVMLETSGERDVSGVDSRVHRIVDLKAPGSGESAKNRWANLPLLGARDQVKLVLADRADYEWARDVIERERLPERVGEVLLSPVHGELSPKELVDWVLHDGLRVRVQLQLHKVIWGADAQGV
jgi:7-carboxy-7-deazaguanine synthase